jgi:glycosyltransferase involved in cell wall biosynthesis
MRRVLMVCPFFVPSASIATKRPLRFVRHLRSFGWEPIVLTVEGSAGSGIDSRQAEFLPTDLLIDRSYAGRSWALWRQFEAYKAKTRGKGEQAQKGSARKIQLLEDLADFTYDVTPLDRFIPYVFGASRQIIRLCREQRIDAVYVTATPFSAMLAGVWAKQKTGLPLVLDLRDPWVIDPLYFHKKLALLQALERRIEHQCFTAADRVLLNTQRAASAYRQRYPTLQDKIFHLHNGFDTQLFLPSLPAALQANTIVHFGNFYRHRTMGTLLHAVQKLSGGSSPSVRLVVYGNFREEDRALAASLGILERLEERKTVPYAQAMQELSKAGVLLLIQSEDTDLQIPAKLFDYLCAKRPILALANNPEISTILQETNTGIAAPNNSEEEITRALEKLLHTPMIAAQSLESFDAASQTRELTEHLDAITR